jgi:hypothetical protein
MKETNLDLILAPLGRFGLLLLASLVWIACSSQPETTRTPAAHEAPATSPQPVSAVAAAAGAVIEKSFGPIKAKVPAEWTEQTPSSSMRKAQYALPKVAGDGEDGELAVFYFGLGQGGSVEANIERWIGQISQSDGSSSKDKAKTSKKDIGGMPVTLVDVSGTYSAGMMSNAPPRQGYRMLAAVAETTEGPWFFKLTGPENTVAKWSGSFDQFINSFKQ